VFYFVILKKKENHSYQNFLVKYIYHGVLSTSFDLFYIEKLKATYHITRQASINARTSVRYPTLAVKQTALSICACDNN